MEIHFWSIDEKPPQAREMLLLLNDLEDVGFETIGVITNYIADWKAILNARLSSSPPRINS